MARFRGTIKGNRGEVSRLGHSGFTAKANGWELGAEVNMHDDDGADAVAIELTTGSNGRGGSLLVGEFRVNNDGLFERFRPGHGWEVFSPAIGRFKNWLA